MTAYNMSDFIKVFYKCLLDSGSDDRIAKRRIKQFLERFYKIKTLRPVSSTQLISNHTIEFLLSFNYVNGFVNNVMYELKQSNKGVEL